MTMQDFNSQQLASNARTLFNAATSGLDQNDDRLKEWQIEFCYYVTDIENGSPPIAEQAAVDCEAFIDGIKKQLEGNEA